VCFLFTIGVSPAVKQIIVPGKHWFRIQYPVRRYYESFFMERCYSEDF
jgi:hypothetical protein